MGFVLLPLSLLRLEDSSLSVSKSVDDDADLVGSVFFAGPLGFSALSLGRVFLELFEAAFSTGLGGGVGIGDSDFE